MAIKKSVKKKIEKKKKVVKKPVKNSSVKKKLVKKKVVRKVLNNHPLEPTPWQEFLDEFNNSDIDMNQPCKLVLEENKPEEKVYKWVNIIFHDMPMMDKIQSAYNLGGNAVSVAQYKKNKDMFDKLFTSSPRFMRENDGLELEKDDNVCKLYKNEDGTINKVVLFEFPKSELDRRDREYLDMFSGLEGVEKIDARWGSSCTPTIGSIDVRSQYFKEKMEEMEEFEKLIGPVEDPVELAVLMKEKNREEWEKRKEAYLGSKIDSHEIDYLGEHSTFKKVADKYLDKEQKEIADLMGMSRFRYLLGWIEDILDNVDAYGFYARGRVKVEGYDSFE
jgi:hypothetical protein